MTINHNGWFIMENPIKMDDLGIPLSLENPHMFLFNYIRFLFKKTTRPPPPPATPEVWGVNQMTSRGVGTNKDHSLVLGFLGNFFLVAFRISTYIQYIHLDAEA